MLDFTLATQVEICAELGKRLRAQRLAQLISQEDLAQRAAVSRGTVRALESTGLSSVESLVRVATALGLADDLGALFALKTHSIADMEKAEQSRRQRAPRRT